MISEYTLIHYALHLKVHHLNYDIGQQETFVG